MHILGNDYPSQVNTSKIGSKSEFGYGQFLQEV